MRKANKFFNIIAALSLVMMLLGSTSIPARADNEKELKADPRLLQMAEENPDATFMVIVQKDAKNKDLKDMELEKSVEKGGGQVKKQLDMIVSFSAEMTGKEITKLAKHPQVHWISADAPVVSNSGPGMDTVRDEFQSQTYAGSSGTEAWSTNWIEGDQSGDAATSTASVGVFRVSHTSRCANGVGYCLQVDSDIVGGYAYREADLNGVVSVNLSFYRNNQLNSTYGTSEQVQLQISSDGGENWTSLRTYTSTLYLGAGTDSFDISAYASQKTRIRFLISKNQSGTRSIYFDNIEIAYAHPGAYRETSGLNQLISETGLSGKGVTVAVVDSGIADKHPDFMAGNQSRVIANTFFGNQGSAKDLYGHGTHVAGIIGGNGTASSGNFRGMAPEVNLINLKVSDKDGMTYESSVLESLQWVYNNKELYHIRVVNISMNSTVAQSYHTSPLDAAVEVLWFNGVVVVVSAGNNGTGEGSVTIYPPANDPFVITVGATEDKGTPSLEDDFLAVFSAYGTTSDGFAKPELVAPGRNLIAPLSDKAATAYTAHPLHRVGDSYIRMSGTSMSAPVVSGAVALLLQDEPSLNPDQVKYRLMATACQAWNYDPLKAGAGYLDVYSAVYSTTSESANIGIAVSQMLSTAADPIRSGSVGWNSVGWNSVGWNSVGWNSVGWNSVGWNSSTWDD